MIYMDPIEIERFSILTSDDDEEEVKKERRRKYVNKYNKKYADCRNGNLDPNSSSGKGYTTEVLVAKFLGIWTCFDLTDIFNYPKYDMLEHKDWGIIDVKGSSLLLYNNSLRWLFCTCRNTKPDFFFCIGYDKNMKRVINVYIIPNEEYVSKLMSISIPYNSTSKWDNFKESEEEVKKWDDLFHTMKLENCPVLRGGQDAVWGKDIIKKKKWK